MEKIDLHTHAKEIQKSYENVVRGNDNSTSWVIYGPDTTKAYKVSATGSSFDDFLDGFDDSQIQFGLARVNPPNSDVLKNLLIGWCPDTAPLKSRSSFAQNFSEVARLLKGYHIQVTARDSDDLDKNELLSRVSAAAGARYSIQAARSNVSSAKSAFSSSADKAEKPAVSKPAVTKPVPEPKIIKPAPAPAPTPSKDDEDDWNEPEIQERDFTKNPLKPNTSTYKPIGKVDLQKVIKEETSKPDPRLEIEQLRAKDRLAKDEEIDSYLKTQSTAFQSKIPTPNSSTRSDRIVGGISKNFGADNGKTPAQLWAERKAASGGSTTASPEPISKPAESNEDNDENEIDVNELKNKFNNLEVEAEEEAKEDEVSYKPKFGKSLPGFTAPKPAQEEEEQPTPSLPARSEPEPEPEAEEEEEEEAAPAPVLPARDAAPAPVAEPAAEPEQEEEEQAEVVAIAEYDYEAGEDNEISFKEGDKIVSIEFVDEDWWIGEVDGNKGLFPANYVSLVN